LEKEEKPKALSEFLSTAFRKTREMSNKEEGEKTSMIWAGNDFHDGRGKKTSGRFHRWKGGRGKGERLLVKVRPFRDFWRRTGFSQYFDKVRMEKTHFKRMKMRG